MHTHMYTSSAHQPQARVCLLDESFVCLAAYNSQSVLHVMNHHHRKNHAYYGANIVRPFVKSCDLCYYIIWMISGAIQYGVPDMVIQQTVSQAAPLERDSVHM